MRAQQWSFCGALCCYANQNLQSTRGKCVAPGGVWLTCLPDCHRSTTFTVCGLERERGGVV